MGEVIRVGAAAADIMKDVAETLTKATAMGGKWQALADEQLGSVVTLASTIAAQLVVARAAAAPLVAKVDAENLAADKLLGKVSDTIWNALGRPRSDAGLSILFPGGYSYYAEGDTAGQPDRMDVLVQLLLSGIHPRLDPAVAQAAATEVQGASTTLRAAVSAASQPAAQLGVLERVEVAVARAARIELASLKRLYKVAGFSETEIHKVIPDRTAAAPKKTPDAAPVPVADPQPA